MATYGLYLSGLYYGNIEFQDGTAHHESYNVHTGELGKKIPIGEEAAAYYQSIFNIDLTKLALQIDDIKAEINATDTNKFKLERGYIFERWEKDNPYGEEIWAQREVKYPWDLTVKNGEIIAITVPSRERITVLVRNGEEGRTILNQWREYLPIEKTFLVSEMLVRQVIMRDGVKLSTAVILPKGMTEPGPSILIRTPYGKETLREVYYPFVRRGYSVIIQDVRGRNESEGDWEPMVHESGDGDDTLNWIGKQSWSNGYVGMLGGSYLGYVQWAAAGTGNPHLKALASIVCSGGPFTDIPRKGGTMNSGTLGWAFALSQKKFKPELMIREDWEQVMEIRPLTDICQKALGYQIPFIEQWINHTDYDEMWDKMNWAKQSAHMKAPALIISGWYDDNQIGTTEALECTKDFPKGSRKVILGPWVHSGNANRDLHGVPLGNNALRYDVDLIILKWFDKQLKRIENGIDKTAPVEYYSVGSEQWKTAETWPIPGLKPTELYLGRNGVLLEEPAEDGFDAYRYDPTDLTPYLVDVSENEFGVPGNYRDVDSRSDVLIYETPPFSQERTITGDIHIDFYGGSDVPDTDFVVKTEDVDPQGNAIKMADGMLSAKYRNGFDKAEFMEQGQIYNFSIKTGKISATLLKGHKLRLTFTSSAQGLCFPNSNTKEGYNSKEKRIANNAIHYGKRYPSKVILQFEE